MEAPGPQTLHNKAPSNYLAPVGGAGPGGGAGASWAPRGLAPGHAGTPPAGDGAAGAPRAAGGGRQPGPQHLPNTQTLRGGWGPPNRGEPPFQGAWGPGSAGVLVPPGLGSPQATTPPVFTPARLGGGGWGGRAGAAPRVFGAPEGTVTGRGGGSAGDTPGLAAAGSCPEDRTVPARGSQERPFRCLRGDPGPPRGSPGLPDPAAVTRCQRFGRPAHTQADGQSQAEFGCLPSSIVFSACQSR